MLRGARLAKPHFSKTAGYVGIAGNALAAGFVLPAIGTIFAFLGMLVSAVWLVMVGRGLLREARSAGSVPAYR